LQSLYMSMEIASPFLMFTPPAVISSIIMTKEEVYTGGYILRASLKQFE
jgi:hypothetical protein